MSNNLDRQYQTLLQDILDNGHLKKDRTGTGTLSVFGRQIRHRMSEGFPLLTTKKMAFKSIITELIWFVMGGTNIKFLVDNDCHIWDGDAYKRYVTEWCKNNNAPTKLAPSQNDFINLIKTDDEFAKKWGELGPVYGKQWRSWTHGKQQYKDQEGKFWLEFEHYDQIQNLIDDLKRNPDSRRLMVNAWNVGELNQMVLPPCHYGFQVWTRELSARERTALGSKGSTALYDMIKAANYVTIDADVEMHRVCDLVNVPRRAISLMWNQRSVDTFLGLPFNIASYGALLVMLADELGMVPDELIGNLGDTHLYLNHIEQAKEQISREPFPLPTLTVEDGMYCRHVENFYLENYQSHPAIKAPLSN